MNANANANANANVNASAIELAKDFEVPSQIESKNDILCFRIRMPHVAYRNLRNLCLVHVN